MNEVQIQTALLKAGVLTVDEVRAMRGLGPLNDTAGPDGRKNTAATEEEAEDKQ